MYGTGSPLRTGTPATRSGGPGERASGHPRRGRWTIADSFLVTIGTLGASLVCYTHFLGLRRPLNDEASAGPGPSPSLGIRVEVNRQGPLRVAGLNKSELGKQGSSTTWPPHPAFRTCCSLRMPYRALAGAVSNRPPPLRRWFASRRPEPQPCGSGCGSKLPGGRASTAWSAAGVS